MNDQKSRPLRIALLTNYIAPYTVASGIGELYRTLAEGLGSAGHHVTVIGVNIHPSPTSQHDWGEIVSLPVRDKIKFIPRSVQKAIDVAVEMFNRRRSFDVVEGPSFPGTLAFLLNPRLPTAARVITSIAVDSEFKRSQTIAVYLLEWLSVRRATIVFCSTDYIQKKAQKVYGFKFPHVARIAFGVADVSSRDDSNESAKRTRFLVIAGATARKGTDVLIAALAKLVTSSTDFELEIIGPGYANYDSYVERFPDLQTAWSAVKLKLEDRLVVRSDVSDSEKALALARCHYVLMTSRSESFGIPVIEAMRAGRPVISSRGGALPEVAGVCKENLFYNDPEDADGLASILLEAVTNGVTDAVRRSTGARAAYEAHYTAQAFISGSVEGYRRAIESRQRNRKVR